MKKFNANLAVILLTMVGYTGCQQSGTLSEEVITVDISVSYPEKELILQDFMDVEYIPLETTDDFITHGIVASIGKDILLVKNRNDGNIFIFDRKTGKGLRKINRFGQGAEEYSGISELVLDEDNREMFVISHAEKKIWVYDLHGVFQRSFKFADTSNYNYTFNYDRDNLICYKSYLFSEEDKPAGHVLVSKQDGSITCEIQTPFKEIETPVIREGEFVIMPEYYLTFPNPGKWALMNTSSDTIYNYSPNGSLSPIIVRTPTVLSMEKKVFLFPIAITDRYYFMRTLKRDINTKTFKIPSPIDLMYDKQENAIFQYTVYNNDYSNKRQVSLGQKLDGIVNQEIAACRPLGAFDLVEAYGKGELKGKLKEIAANLDEESNPVIMLVKYRK